MGRVYCVNCGLIPEHLVTTPYHGTCHICGGAILGSEMLGKLSDSEEASENKSLIEQKEEVERKASERNYYEIKNQESFFDKNPDLKPLKPCFEMVRDQLGRKIVRWQGLPKKEGVSESLQEKISMLPDIRINDAVRAMEDDLMLNNEIGEIARETDEIGDLFHIAKPVECPSCREEKESFRLSSESDWVCDSCYKVRLVTENLEKRME